MSINLHDEFSHSDHPPPSDIVRRCKQLLYTLPTGRHLVDLVNLHHIPIGVEISETPGYRVVNHATIILACPETPEAIPLYEMAIHLACGIRIVELHMQTYLSPEMKDSRTWQNPHLAEPFEVMLTICKITYDMNYFSKNPEVEKFLETHDYAPICHAYAQNMPYSHLEELMLKSFNTRN